MIGTRYQSDLIDARFVEAPTARFAYWRLGQGGVPLVFLEAAFPGYGGASFHRLQNFFLYPSKP